MGIRLLDGTCIIEKVHISTIKNGDVILHLDGNVRTVNNCNIKTGFLGLTIFGDSYKLGTVLVSKLIKVNQNN